MKTRLVRIAALILAGVSLASAQPGRWSALQQEVIDHLKMRMDAWGELGKTGDTDAYFARCSVAADAAYWNSGNGAPIDESRGSVRRNIDLIQADAAKWSDFVPIAITVSGDVAVAHFYAYWKVSRNGRREVDELRATETFRKVEGKWTFLGGQITPVAKPTAVR